MGEHRAVVWLDRDGTIVDDPGYLKDPDALALLPGAAEAIATLNRAGATVVLVTNQSGIARGLMTREDVDAVHRALARELARAGAHLDDLRICPHLPSALLTADQAPCACRKPRPGLVLQARAQLGIDAGVPQVVVGDKRADLELAVAVGARAVLVLTGDGRVTRDELEREGADAPRPDHVSEDLSAALPWLLDELGLAEPGPRC